MQALPLGSRLGGASSHVLVCGYACVWTALPAQASCAAGTRPSALTRRTGSLVNESLESPY